MVISLRFPGPAARSVVLPLDGHRSHNSAKAVWVHVHVNALVLPCPDLEMQQRTRVICVVGGDRQVRAANDIMSCGACRI